MIVIDYMILEYWMTATLQKMVTEAIQKGWQPLGGISTGNEGSGSKTYAQAMVKYKVEEDIIYSLNTKGITKLEME